MDEITLNLSAAMSTIVGRNVLEGKDFEPEVLDLLLQLLASKDSPIDKPGLFLDIGSNIGYFPLTLGKYCEKKNIAVEIFAHEPLPVLQRISSKLQEDNAIRYSLQTAALSDSVGEQDFFVSSASDSSNSLVKGFRKAKDVIRVQVETLDTAYLGKLRQAPPGQFVLMIDVETAEPAVLRGGKQVLSEFRPMIICEVLAGRTEQQINEVLAPLRYSYYRFDGTAWVREDSLWGDKTYRYRDWLFVPSEREADFGARFEVAHSCIVKAFRG